MKKLTIAGLGVREFDQLTLEAVEALRASSKVLYLATAGQKVRTRLQAFGIENAEDLRPLYRDGAKDIDNYKALLKRVLRACNESAQVCVLLPGHPRVGVTLVYWLEMLKDELKIDLQVLEGISSFCTMINELRIDPLEYGAAILDSNRILQNNQELNPQIDCFIYHVCSVGVSATHLSDPTKDNRLDLLQRKLEQHYDSTHPCRLISASRGSFESTFAIDSRIGDLRSLLHHIHFGTTLFIPSKGRHENIHASPALSSP